MSGPVWDVVVVVCAVVGALTLWTVAAGAIASYVLKHFQRRARRRGGDSPADGAEATVHSLLNRRARSWAEVPAWVKDDREWAAAVVLLGSEGVAARTEPFVDFPERSIDWVDLRAAAASWAPNDRLLVEVAYELARGRPESGSAEESEHPPVALADLATLNGQGFVLLHEALKARGA